MQKGAILYTKPIEFIKNDQVRNITILGVLPSGGGEPIEVVANGKDVKGEACFYKAVAKGEVMYGDRMAEADTNVLVGITSLNNVTTVTKTLAALEELAF